MFVEVERQAQRLGFELLGPAQAALIAARVAEHAKSLWYYYTPFLLGLGAGSEHRRVYAGELGGSKVAFAFRARHGRASCDLVWPPLPLSEASLQAASEAARAMAPRSSPRILWCDGADAKLMRSWQVGVVRPQPPDLLYDPGAVSGLSGPAYQDIRKCVSRFSREHRVEPRSGGPDDVSLCQDLLQQWYKARVEAIRPIGDMGYTRGALSWLGRLPVGALELVLYEVDGTPSAFSAGGEIRPGLICFFALKALPHIRGLSTYVRWDTLSRWADRGVVNDGSDLGRPGLAQQKRKFRPSGQLGVWEVRL